ncbi:MAG: sugar phosphate isomerase/epimerase family protein [Verrucomicrobiota bacterium]
MMPAAVTVSLVPEARGGPFVFWDGLADACQRAASLGFDAIEIFPPDAAAIDVATVRELITRHRLKVAAVGTGGGWVRHKLTLTHADAAIRRDARSFIAALIERAGALAAPAIIGSMQGRSEGSVSRDQALAWLAEGLDELSALAAGHGVPLFYEPLNRYETNLFNRIGDAARWLEARKLTRVQILADLFHMNIEEADAAAALREAGRFVGHVHFVDSNRRALGFGHTSVPPVIAALHDIGYQGYLSAEILPLPDGQAAAAQTMAAFRAATGRP